jgi:predicted NBD/HSP70 family sugar kinase
MKPFGWRERRGPRSTTFTFRSTSLVRALVITLVLSPIPILATDMTIAGARAGDWGWDWVLVVAFDALALGVVAILANMYNRTRIVVDGASVEWSDGPLFATRTRMSHEEARTIRATERRVRRATYIAFDFLRADAPVRLGTTVDDWDRARWVIERVQTEIARH